MQRSFVDGIRIDDERIELRRATLDEIVDLRHDVLRHGLPREAAIFDGDDAPTARHYAAFAAGRAACCATLHASTWEGEPAWQLRGMATDARFRGRGVGRAVMAMVEADVRETSPVHLLWANARVGASRFYQGMGWEIRSDLFEIPTAGLHYRMTKRLPAGRPAGNPFDQRDQRKDERREDDEQQHRRE